MSENLDTYLERELGRHIRREELAVAMGIALATLTRRKSTGFSADEVITAARHFDLSPVEALVALGYVTQDDVNAAAADRRLSLEHATDLQLAEEVYRRAVAGEAGFELTDPLDHTTLAVVSDPADSIGPSREDYGPAASEGGDPDAVSEANEGQA